MSARPRLIAVDGANGRALLTAAHQLARRDQSIKGVSQWDASGLFEQLTVADAADASTASPRTLLLIYAADLAFRLRWEIEPALAEGRPVVAAPYVETALAFGRASGVPAKWLNNLFRFARRPAERHIVTGPPSAGAARSNAGLIEFGSAMIAPKAGRALAARAGQYLNARRGSGRRAGLRRPR